MLKATLIAGANRLPGTAAAGAVVDPHQGYGRVDVAAIAAPPQGVGVRLWDRRTVITGQRRRITVSVASSTSPLRVVLAYSDFPGPSLVNNLNLVVTRPDGTTLLGNAPETGSATFDTANNVEVVQVKAPKPGTWTIDVIGSNVPRGPQPYALVARGPIS